MARHYALKSFFRQIPNALLARYFEGKGVLQDLDFQAMSETRTPALFDAWMARPEEERQFMEAEFQVIFELSCEKGFRAIIDEMRSQKQVEPEAFIGTLSALPNHYYRAMVTFLDHPECWKGATRFYRADTLSYWRKRKHLGHRPAAVDEASLKLLADQLCDYFHRTEGRGNHCVVEPFKRGALDYFFAYPEDYSRQSVEWVNGDFGIRPHHPAFEVIFIYSQTEGTLDIYFRGVRSTLELLQGLFATAILKLETLPPHPKDERVYDLSRLRHRDFEFIYSPESGIESVAVWSSPVSVDS